MNSIGKPYSWLVGVREYRSIDITTRTRTFTLREVNGTVCVLHEQRINPQ